MGEFIVFPDATAIAIDALIDGYSRMGVTTEVKPWVPFDEDTHNVPPLVTVLCSGGAGERNLISDDADITLEAYGESDAAAHDLCAQGRAILHGAQGTVVDGVPVYLVQTVGRPANFPDPSGTPRYTTTVTMTLRGSAASA